MEGKVYDVLGTAIENSGNDVVIIGAGSDGLPDDVADDVADDIFDFGDDSDVTDDVTDVETPDDDVPVTDDEPVDCPEVDFSPLPPECELP